MAFKLFRKRKWPKWLYAGVAAIALGIFGSLSPMASTSVLASPGDHGMDNRPDFGDAQFIPGERWYRVNVEIPGSVIRDVEAELTRRNGSRTVLCKYEDPYTGLWYSNLKMCPANHPQMADATIGRLHAPNSSGRPVSDFFRGNWAYSMTPSYKDILTARLVTLAMAGQLRSAQPVQVVNNGTPARTSTNIEVAELQPVAAAPRREVPAYVRARLGEVMAGLTATPNEEGRFERAGDAFELRKTPDGSSMYAFSFDPYTNEWRPAYNASLRDNGAARLTALTGTVDTGTLVAFNYVAPENRDGILIAENMPVWAHPSLDLRMGGFAGVTFPEIATFDVASIDGMGAYDPMHNFIRTSLLQAETPAQEERTVLSDLRATDAFAEPSLASTLGAPRLASMFGTGVDMDRLPAREDRILPVKDNAPEDKPFADMRVAVLPTQARMDEPRAEGGISPSDAFRTAAIVHRKVQGSNNTETYLRVVTHEGQTIDIATDRKRANGTHRAFVHTGDRTNRDVFELASSPKINSAAQELLRRRAANMAKGPAASMAA